MESPAREVAAGDNFVVADDDSTSTFTCRGTGATNLLGYRITFHSLPTPVRQGATPTAPPG